MWRDPLPTLEKNLRPGRGDDMELGCSGPLVLGHELNAWFYLIWSWDADHFHVVSWRRHQEELKDAGLGSKLNTS